MIKTLPSPQAAIIPMSLFLGTVKYHLKLLFMAEVIQWSAWPVPGCQAAAPVNQAG